MTTPSKTSYFHNLCVVDFELALGWIVKLLEVMAKVGDPVKNL